LPASAFPRSIAIAPTLALLAGRALPAVTATVAAAATTFAAERALRGALERLTPRPPAPPPPSPAPTNRRIVVTEWLTIERRRRLR
jgi:hypothetical protein